MMNIAFLGLGAMGSRMATKLIEAGHAVTVYNRTPARAETLARLGARVAPTPREAASGADAVIAMVRDDDASADVWLADETGALLAMSPSALAIECSTVSLPHVHRLAAAFAGAGRRLTDAPLAGSRPQADAGQLIFFVGGSSADVEIAKAVLAPMAGAIHHAGAVGAGMAVKLMVNGLFGVQLAVFAELLGFARGAGVDVQRAIDIIGATPVCSPAARASAAAMAARSWSPAFPIDLVAKDFALLQRSANIADALVPLSTSTGKIYDQANAAGFGADNITGIVQLYDESGAAS